MFFLEIFFRKFVFQNFKKFSAHTKFMNFFSMFSKKQFPKKNIFFQKKKNAFFQKNKVLVYRRTKCFFLPKHIFFVNN